MTRIRKTLAIVAVATVASGAAIAFVTPPPAAVRQIALATSGWVLTGFTPEDGRLARLGKRFVGSYLQMAIAAQLAEPIRARTDLTDEQALHAMMRLVRTKSVNQFQFFHATKQWPLLLAGAGYCDQVNGAVCMLAAHRFPKAELYALVDPATGTSPHTIGRVWSPQRGTWLYFDAFFAHAVIFTRGTDDRVQFIDVPPADVVAARRPRDKSDMARLQYKGMVLTAFPASFGAFVAARLRGNSAPYAITVPPTAPPRQAGRRKGTGGKRAPVPRVPPVDDRAFRTTARAFVAARLQHLYGAPPVAEYRRIAADPLTLRDDRAAELAALAGTLADLGTDPGE